MIKLSGPQWFAAPARKAPLMVAIVIGAILLAAAAVHAWPDMMPPDGGGQVVEHNPEGQIFVYHFPRVRVGLPMTATRNKTPWVTVTKKGKFWEISDPRGTGNALIKLPAQ